MRGWKTWTTLSALAILVGCTTHPTAPLSLTPSAPPASLASVLAGEPLQPTVEATLPTPEVDGYATLRLAIRWPQPKGYGVASMPLSVRSLRFAVLKGETELASQLVTRQPGDTSAVATLRLKAATDVVLAVKGYAEASPNPQSAVALAIGQSEPFTLQRSKFASVQVSLIPQFPPIVTAMTSPYHGLGDTAGSYYASEGDEIVLTGQNFSRGGTPTVYFNTVATEVYSATPVAATSVTRVSDTQLRVQVPARATTGNPVVVVDGITTEVHSPLWIPQVAIDAPKQSYDPFPADTRLVPDELGYTGTSPAVPHPIPGAKLAATATVSWTVNTPDAYDVFGTPPQALPTWEFTNDIGSWVTATDYSILYTPDPLPPGAEYNYTDLYAKLGSAKSNTLKLVIGNVCKAYPFGCM
ncbi:MAG TPA: IPT/TIG domain-containing protein [Stenomitos sp.]